MSAENKTTSEKMSAETNENITIPEINKTENVIDSESKITPVITETSKETSDKEGDDKIIDSSPTKTANPITSAVAESKNGYSFVGDKIFKVTQDATNGTCVIPSSAKEVKDDNDFINSMKTTLGMAGGSRSANKKNKITCKKKGGRKYKKSMKHKKGAKKW